MALRPAGSRRTRYDWIMRGPRELQAAFWGEVVKERGAGRTPYLMDIERQWLAEGARNILASWIEDKYGSAGADAATTVRLISDDTAISRIAAAVQANAPLAEVQALVDEVSHTARPE